jgi:acyl carrier protein
METRVKQIMSDVFFVKLEEINENTSPLTLEQWDSIGQLNLATSLEEEYNIVFTDQDISEMLNFKLVIAILNDVLKR